MDQTEKMKKALEEAQKAWDRAEGTPLIYPRETNETGKIALAILAVKLFDHIES